MKRSITTSILRSEIVTFDVEFPLYRKSDATLDEGVAATYSRIGVDMREVSIAYTSFEGTETYVIQVNPASFQIEGGRGVREDLVLGKGEHACTAEEFNSVMRKAIQAIEGQP